VSHLDVESEFVGGSPWSREEHLACQDTGKKTAGMPGGFMKLVGFRPSSSAYMAHDASDSDSGSHRLARWRRETRRALGGHPASMVLGSPRDGTSTR
jgi:hypothetical protein